MKKLYRSTRDKKLFGLCGGLAESIGVDATLLRILAIVLAVFTSGGFILVYILAAFVVPKEPPLYGPYNSGYNGYGGSGGYYNPPHGGGWNGGGPAGYPGPGAGAGQGAPHGTPHQPPHAAPPSPGNLDAMMDDLEKKALRREIEELKAKIKQLEKGE